MIRNSILEDVSVKKTTVRKTIVNVSKITLHVVPYVDVNNARMKRSI